MPGSARRRRIGVLALQGAFARHAERLSALGHDPRLVRDAAGLAELDGLVLPGGESTVQLELIARLGMEAPLDRLVRSGRPVLATCAGLILGAARVTHPQQRSFGWIDVDVERNAYGRQLDSFEGTCDAPPERDGTARGALDEEPPLPLVFIRAPRITRVGPNVVVLARLRGEPVLVRERNVTAACFHPELTADPRVHRLVFD